jgi:hypothetical protein
MVRLDTPLAKTIEKRLLLALQNSTDWQMTFPELVKAAKCERWFELCKHVIGRMEVRKLVRSTGFNSVELVITGSDTYPQHLNNLLYTAEQEVIRLKDLIKKQKVEKFGWPEGYTSYGGPNGKA